LGTYIAASILFQFTTHAINTVSQTRAINEVRNDSSDEDDADEKPPK